MELRPPPLALRSVPDPERIGPLRMKILSALLGLLLTVQAVHAWSRTIVVEVIAEDDGRPVATLYSDREDERRTRVSLAHACDVLQGVKPGGSLTLIFIYAPKNIQMERLLPIFSAVSRNPSLSLQYVRNGSPSDYCEAVIKKMTEPVDSRNRPKSSGR